jgi:hypothetical protein
MLQPGEDFPAEGASSSSSATAAASTSTTSTTAGMNLAMQSKKSRLAAGAIAGIVLGMFAIIGLAAALCYFVGRTRKWKETYVKQSMAASPCPSPSPFSPHPQGSMYQTTGFVPMVKPTDFHQHSRVVSNEVPPYCFDQNTAYAGGYVSPPGSPPTQFYVGTCPTSGRHEYGHLHFPQPTFSMLTTCSFNLEEGGPILASKSNRYQGPVEMFASIPKRGDEI